MIGPGVVLLSDPVDLTFAPLADLAVSLYIPGETGPPTNHATALHTAYIQSGDATSTESMPDAVRTQAYYWLAGIDVAAPSAAAAIVTFGDSITDGARSSNETNHSWPALLAVRLAADKATTNIGVANMGIGGNRVLRDVSGVSALGRFDRDVLSQSGVKWVMLLEGINDIGHGTTAPAEAVTAENLIGSYKQLIERAHTQGVLVISCTLTPYESQLLSRGFRKGTRRCQCVDPHAWQLRRIRRFRSCRPRSGRSEEVPRGVRSGRSFAPERQGLRVDGECDRPGDFQRDEGEAVTGSVAFRSTPKLDRIVIESGWSGPSAFS